MPLTDEKLAQQITATTFGQRDDKPVLPAKGDLLGQRLYDGTIRRDGTLKAALGPRAQTALHAKGFTLVTIAGIKGKKVGLHPDTPRPRQHSIPDEELARLIASHTFNKSNGHPALPVGTSRLGKRLHDGLILHDGILNSALGPQAQTALHAKGFTLVTIAGIKGDRVGLHPDTPRSREAGDHPAAPPAQQPYHAPQPHPHPSMHAYPAFQHAAGPTTGPRSVPFAAGIHPVTLQPGDTERQWAWDSVRSLNPNFINSLAEARTIARHGLASEPGDPFYTEITEKEPWDWTDPRTVEVLTQWRANNGRPPSDQHSAPVQHQQHVSSSTRTR